MQNKTTKLVLLALLVALNIVLVRFGAIYLGPSLRITFGFIPIVIMGILFGPVSAAVGAGVADFIGAILFPAGGAYFPGFTLSSIVTGYIYGKMLYGHKLSITRIVVSNLLVILIVQLFMNSIWVSMLYDKAFIVLISTKIVKSLAMLPIESVMILLTYKYISPAFLKYAER
ncbi:MAG: folate family ECF transporter S component [Niameybacter sp.]|uniref:folate family ECF transporter S component n=1 Tax=Niameybacter sp. TaxID=2033640 RepID=UPI002FC8472D